MMFSQRKCKTCPSTPHPFERKFKGTAGKKKLPIETTLKVKQSINHVKIGYDCIMFCQPVLQ